MHLARPALGTSAMEIESDFGLIAMALDPGPHPLPAASMPLILIGFSWVMWYCLLFPSYCFIYRKQ